ncbi:MAG TPA: hypothetical protein PKU82_09635 [Bacteroidia bacterium]|nr:hypothetical protein [Bacteroidia bacterium]
MAKILVNGEWYNELSVGSLYESEFEKLFIDKAPQIFPDYFTVDFKHKVESQHGKGKPDLAIIEKNYRHWFVIEVEKSNHSLENHVLPQVIIFSTADYNDEAAEALKKENESLDIHKLKAMIKGQPPKVLVVVDALKQDWINSLNRWEAMLSVFQVFRSERNRNVFRLNGFTPKSLTGFFSECYLDKIFKRHLVIISPAIIEVPTNGILTINYNDTISEWKRVDMKNQVVLSPLSINPLDASKKYKLHKKENSSYTLTD